MKTIYNFILEKLTLNKQSSIYWSIEDAKDGDIITFKEDEVYLIFIFYPIEEDENNQKEDIFTYACYSVDDDDGWPTEYLDSAVLGIMTYDKTSKEKFYLSTEDEKQLLFNNLKKHGLKWDPKKKEIEKI